MIVARSQHPYRETATEEVALAPVPTPGVPHWRVAMAVGGGVTTAPPRKPRSLVELAELLSTWGLSVHERYIAEVAVRWAPRSGPPLSL